MVIRQVEGQAGKSVCGAGSAGLWPHIGMTSTGQVESKGPGLGLKRAPGPVHGVYERRPQVRLVRAIKAYCCAHSSCFSHVIVIPVIWVVVGDCQLDDWVY